MPKLKTRSTTESVPSLDVRKLNRDGLLAKGTRSTVKAENTATTTLIACADSIEIAYTLSDGKAQPLRVSQAVTLTTTPCNYGSDRTWFECPCCDRRVAVVYMSDQVACRKCHGLHYRSQSESPKTRMLRRLKKISSELQSSANPICDPTPQRPRHMKKSKYAELVAEAEKIKQDTRVLPTIEVARWFAIRHARWLARLK